ncbi:tRNA-(ms[2]io[6]A)-hydroxylase [Ketobacter sp.]|uniref:tRNA-(ms[2]io[6]A)-hydroxylase n=1 Tax=Ketobacter sp. TaxID=2083498 RepID=UPI000F22C06E|nr:tRNA-(ms[2]io[6]A)-hydroxylase [Ketobacter sp.]RLT98648.1 MAG: tRNA-(ms[2]io[6]A)-hydroxylase [Ketobacter sp.]
MAEMSEVRAFLGCGTPSQWIDAALANLPVLLIDHAHCEKKAASTALNLLFRYVDRRSLLAKLSQLAREELLHFEQVLELMEKHGVQYDHLSPSRYAMGLRKHIRQTEPQKLVDTLIIGAFIEARSCERFEALAPRLLENPETQDIGKYYQFLLKSESRHFEDYLALAREYSPDTIDERVNTFREIERELIESVDQELRFHSGIPS